MIVLSPQRCPIPGQVAFVELRDDHVLCANGARLIGDAENAQHDHVYAPPTNSLLTGMAATDNGIVVTDANMHTHFALWKV